MANRLAHETSPYLLQHKDNPVDWYPWGEEAFDRARAEDKPVLLSVGYAACHWCHVMERESFEDPDTADHMNAGFISIKVDREERPDIDSIYMDAVQAMTGRGGWPMTVFLTPEGAPFYGGTYFPPEDRHGMPSFRSILEAVGAAWRERRDELGVQSERLVRHMAVTANLKPSADPIDAVVLDAAHDALKESFDERFGGFGKAPKFPQPMNVDLLLRLAHRGKEGALAMAVKTLDGMAAGGMFDQIGGGFARYSVDPFWLIPHFEKMLYDNAQLLRTYARSFLVTKKQRHRDVVYATAEWMLREMRDPAGGFWSSLDADSEGEEGKFYAWDFDEVRDVAGSDADDAIEHWGMTSEGNFEGRNVPVFAVLPRDLDAIDRARAALMKRREERVRPPTDDKVLAGWNGLAVTGLVEAGTVFGEPGWIEAGAESFRFVMETLRVDGRLMRSYRNGVVNHLGVAEDYAFMLEASLSLFEAGDTARLEDAVWLADRAIEMFLDDDLGGFFTTGSDAESLVTRPKDLVDNALPSANSVFALELQRLALITGEQRYEEAAAGAIRVVYDAAKGSPLAFGHLLSAVDLYASDAREIVIVGDERAAAPLLDVVHGTYLPNRVLVVAADASDLVDKVPLLQGRDRIEGKATAFVCRRGVCELPVTEPEALRSQLGVA